MPAQAPDPLSGDRARFETGSVTGYDNNEPEPRTTWYVYDLCNAHRIVVSFDGASAERRAKDFSHKLNQCDELTQRVLAGEISLGPPRKSDEAEEVTRTG